MRRTQPKPLVQPFPKSSWPNVVDAAELVSQSEFAEQRDGLTGVGAKNDCGPEDALQPSDQRPVLRAALWQPGGVKHVGGARKGDSARLLSIRQGCKEEWNQAILSPRQPIVGVPGDEEH